MRRLVVMALACAALLPAQAVAAVPMKAVILHLTPTPLPPAGSSAPDAVRHIEQAGRRAQAPVLAQLAELRREGHVRHVRPLWIADAVALSGDATALAALEARPDVQSIEADSELPIQPADAVTGEPGIASTGAPALWAQGVDGHGITVATLDTGVDLTHPQLAARYRGGVNSWFDPYGQHPSAPVDMTGHGTQVTGVIVAGAGIGMAPGAQFIAARAFDDTGASTASAIHLAFQWLLDPDHDPATHDAPNVVNLSWGARQACNLEFQPDLQALRSAHILPVAAAGNDGQTIPQPPALSPDNSPANLPEAFAVGALQSATAIAPFSSAGPSSCSGGQFPALVAPGTGIRSTNSGGFDATNLAGTSFSAPHVAGALALLLQVAPQLTATEQANLLTQSADDLGAPGADSIFGAGSLDLVAAARSLHSPALDFDPPVLSGAASTDTTAQVRADDVLSAIARGEWWADGDPGIGAGEPLSAADGAFDSHSEMLVASTTGLTPGPHLLGMRGRDAAGNWSAARDPRGHHPGSATAAGGRPRSDSRARGAARARRARAATLVADRRRPRARRERRLRARTRRVAPARRSRSGIARGRDLRPARPAGEARCARAVVRTASPPARRQRGRARVRAQSAHVLERGRLGRGGGDHERERSAPRFRGSALAARPA